MLLIIALLLIVVFVTVVIVKNKVEDVPVEDVSVTDVVVPVEDINVIDVGIAEDITLETLYQMSPPRSRSPREEAKGRKPRSKPRSQGQKTYVSSWSSVVIIEAETEEERIAREFDEQLYGRRAAKRKANHEDLNPSGRRPRDEKEKGDFRIDRRLKASRQKAVVESRAV